MNRRTLLKGLASLPLLRHLDLSLSTEAEAAPIEAETVPDSIDWPKNAFYGNPNRFSYLDSGPLDLGIARGAMCAPILPVYELFMEEWERPVRDLLPVLKAPRGGICFIKSE